MSPPALPEPLSNWFDHLQYGEPECCDEWRLDTPNESSDGVEVSRGQIQERGHDTHRTERLQFIGSTRGHFANPSPN